VFEEPGVLGGDKGLDDEVRQLSNLDDLPVFKEEFVHQFVVVGIDAGGDAGPVVLQGIDARQFP